MTSLFSVMKHVVSVTILVVVAMQLLSIHRVFSLNQTNAYLHHKCITSLGKYKPGSPYAKQLKEDFKFLSESSLKYDFTQSSSGEYPNDVFTRYQCRGDISLPQCGSCITTATSEIRKRCPRNKGRIIWFDHCVLEITSVFRWPQLDSENIFYLHNPKDVITNKESFNKKTRDLFCLLRDKANNSRRAYNFFYAAGKESIGKATLYAMVQCTQDLSRRNCSVCLDGMIAKLPKCCNGKQGGRVLCTSCNLRYELYPFVKPVANESSV